MKFSRFRVIATAACVVLSTTAAAAGIAVSGSAEEPSRLVAQFESAAPLVVGNEVKLDGVVVGEVLDIRATDGHADVVLELEAEAMPVHQDATFTIRPVSLLGERYVDFDRGSVGKPAHDPSEPIPPSQTGTNVDLDEILNVLDEPTSEGLAMLVTTLGEGLGGNGEEADAAIRALAPSMGDTEELAAVLAEHNELLNSLIEQAEPVAEALAAEDGKALDELAGSADRLLEVSAEQQEAVDETLAELPGTLESVRMTLRQVTATAEEATPTLRELRPVTDELQEISDELMTFADSLDPALATAQPVLERAEVLLDEAAPVAEHLRAAGSDVRESAESARPIVKDLTANLDNVFNFIRYWALATNGHDGLSHYFRVNLIVHPDAVTGMLPGGSLGGEEAGGPVEEALPDLPPVDGLLEPAEGEDPDSADPTGLSREQEGNMTDFLFGGDS